MVCGFSAVHANPIYMKYDGIDGSVSGQVEVQNGKATLKKLKPGTYRLSLVFTGKDAKTRDGKPRSNAHVKVFDGRTGFSGGVRVAAGDVTGDGKNAPPTTPTISSATKSDPAGVTMAEYGLLLAAPDGRSSTGRGAGKVSVHDISIMLQPNGNDVAGQLGTIKITPGAAPDSFFDVFTELTIQ